MYAQKVSLVSSFLAIISNFGIFWYLNHLENIGCKCSESTQRTITKNFVLLNFFLIVGAYLTQSRMPSVIRILYGTYSMAMLVNTFIYLHKLKTEKCKCADHLIRDVMYYYYMIKILIIILAVTLLLLLVLALHHTLPMKKK
jgi:hypothetical protein